MTQVAQAKVVHGGRVVLPAAMRRALGLNTGDTVFMELDGDELRLRSARSAIRQVQEELRRHAPKDGRSIVDEFIAERRRETERDWAGRE